MGQLGAMGCPAYVPPGRRAATASSLPKSMLDANSPKLFMNAVCLGAAFQNQVGMSLKSGFELGIAAAKLNEVARHLRNELVE